MTRAGIRDLKNNLSRYLRRVRKGERILVTDRGEVIAELRPPEQAVENATSSRFDQLVASGVIRPPLSDGDPFADWPPAGTIRLPPGTAQEALDWVRGDR